MSYGMLNTTFDILEKPAQREESVNQIKTMFEIYQLSHELNYSSPLLAVGFEF